MRKRLLLSILFLLIPTIAIPEAGWRPMPGDHTDADTVSRSRLTATDSLRALEKLADDIAALVRIPEAKSEKLGIEVKSLTTNKMLFSLNADKPLTPASTTKLVTTFTALCELGSNYMVRTAIAAEGRPRNGVVAGNLYVKGYGDPFFSINEIDQLVDRILAAGIRQIQGNIVGDGTFFDEKTERTEYSGDEDVVVQLPPIAALTIEQSVFTVVVSSPRTPGVPCNVQTYPPSSGFQIINNAVTSSPPAPRKPRKKSRRRSDLLAPYVESAAARYGDETPTGYILPDEPVSQRKPKKGAKETAKTSKKKTAAATKKSAAEKSGRKTTAAAAASKKKSTAGKATATKTGKGTTGPVAAKKTTAPSSGKITAAAKVKESPAEKGAGPLRISVSTGENGRQIITVSGSLAPNKTVSRRYQMKNPPLVIAGMIYDRLRSHGVKIEGKATSGITPARHIVIAETGRQLQEILQTMMKNSNNLLAEYVFKIIGGAAGGQQETAEKTVEKIHHQMTINHIPFGKCVINDGSGLSRANCLSASALTGILSTAFNEPKLFEPLYQSMSIAGVDGTLRKRMRGSPAEGNAHGKTGTLRNVSALAGYVTTRDGEWLCFSMLMNGFNHGTYRAVQDKVAKRLASFSYSDIPADAK